MEDQYRKAERLIAKLPDAALLAAYKKSFMDSKAAGFEYDTVTLLDIGQIRGFGPRYKAEATRKVFRSYMWMEIENRNLPKPSLSEVYGD